MPAPHKVAELGSTAAERRRRAEVRALITGTAREVMSAMLEQKIMPANNSSDGGGGSLKINSFWVRVLASFLVASVTSIGMFAWSSNRSLGEMATTLGYLTEIVKDTRGELGDMNKRVRNLEINGVPTKRLLD